MIGVPRTEPEGLEMSDLGRQLWAAYLDRHVRPERVPPAIDNVGPGGVAELIFDFLPLFRPLLEEMKRVPFDSAHDAEADEALEWLALDGGPDRWEALSLGAWRVLLARMSWSIAALMLEEQAGSKFIVPLPRHATKQQRATAALLLVLGTFGRKPLPPWRDELPPAALRVIAAAPSTRH
jgi:hypothetical protein